MPLCPPDMNDSEKALLATITAQTIARRHPTTDLQMDQALSEADQIAAETIWAARAEEHFSDQDLEEQPPPPREGWTADYYRNLAAAAAANQITFQEDEDYDEDLPPTRPPTPGGGSSG